MSDHVLIFCLASVRTVEVKTMLQLRLLH